jgi:dynein heavy chain, axonemal
MLSLMQDLLDAWLACQANWLYMEPIFSSPDIIKQMPQEGEKFATVDVAWRSVMSIAALSPAALPLGRDPVALESLRECNGLLDEVQKGLTAYLEKKRLFFPRYDCPALALIDEARIDVSYHFRPRWRTC